MQRARCRRARVCGCRVRRPVHRRQQPPRQPPADIPISAGHHDVHRCFHFVAGPKSTAADERHLRRHDGHEQDVRVERQAGHVDARPARRARRPSSARPRSCRSPAARPWSSPPSCRCGHCRYRSARRRCRTCGRRATIDFGQPGDRVLGRRVRRRIRPRRVRRDRAVVDDPPAARRLALSSGETRLARTRNAPVRLTATTPDHCANVRSSSGTGGAFVPALLNSTSIRPHCSAAAAKSVSTEAGSATSAAIATVRPDGARAAVSSSASRRRPARTDREAGVDEGERRRSADSAPRSGHQRDFARRIQTCTRLPRCADVPAAACPSRRAPKITPAALEGKALHAVPGPVRSADVRQRPQHDCAGISRIRGQRMTLRKASIFAACCCMLRALVGSQRRFKRRSRCVNSACMLRARGTVDCDDRLFLRGRQRCVERLGGGSRIWVCRQGELADDVRDGRPVGGRQCGKDARARLHAELFGLRVHLLHRGALRRIRYRTFGDVGPGRRCGLGERNRR